MMQSLKWPMALLFSATVLSSWHVTAADTSDDLVGRKITVIDLDAKFIAKGEEAGAPEFGDSFVVEAMNGDLLLLKSPNAYIKRSSVAPYEEAIDHLTRAIQTNPSAFNYTMRGRCFDTRYKYDSAIKDFNAAIQLEPKTYSHRLLRGEMLKRTKEFDKALIDFNEAIRLSPDRWQLYIYRGRVHCLLGDFEKGISDFNKAIEMEPNNTVAYCCRGVARFLKNEPPDGLTDLGIAIRLEPRNFEAYSVRAEIALDRGNYDNALLDYDELIRLHRVAGLNNIAWVRSTFPDDKLRNGKQAVRDATEACEITGWENSECLHTLSAALAEAGRFDEAVKRLQQSMEMNPKSDKAVCDEMMAAFRAGKPFRQKVDTRRWFDG